MAVMQNRAPWHRSDWSACRGTGLTGRSDRSDWFGPGRPNSAWRGCLSHEEIRRHTILIILCWWGQKLGLGVKLEYSLIGFLPLFCRLKSISKSCISFCDCLNLPKKPSANCLMESNVKLTSLGVEADEAATVAIVDGFGGGGVNVGMMNLSFSNMPCRVFP